MITRAEALAAEAFALELEEAQFRQQKDIERWLDERIKRKTVDKPAYPQGRWTTRPKDGKAA